MLDDKLDIRPDNGCPTVDNLVDRISGYLSNEFDIRPNFGYQKVRMAGPCLGKNKN